MRRERLDALVAMHPHHVYYLSDHWSPMMDARWEVLYVAVLTREASAPSTLIVPAMGAFLLAASPTWMDQVIPITAPAGDSATGAPPAVGFPDFPEAPGISLPENEQKKKTLIEAVKGHAAATAPWALHRALEAAGAKGGRVGFDDYRTAAWAAGTEFDARFVPAIQLFQEIRLVKTPDEIALMRRAATINEDSMLAAVAAIKTGMDSQSVERIYMQEMAARDGQGVFLITALGELPEDHFTPGSPVMVDAFGRYRQYHGDVGRTVVIGDPSPGLLRRNKAMKTAWLAALDMIRPGVSYADIRDTVARAAADAGMPELMPCNPHNLGLSHTDDPAPEGAPPGVKPDITLEPGMVINVDMPYQEYGWGALHTEDTILITESGWDPLTSNKADLIVL